MTVAWASHVPTAADERQATRKPAETAHDAQQRDRVRALAGGIGHELNNHLTAVLGYGTLLADQVAENPEAVANVKAVLAGAQGIADVASQLLRFGSRRPLSAQPVELPTALALLEDRVRQQFGERASLVLSVHAPVPDLVLDAEGFDDALFAVVSAAVWATPAKGVVSIVVSEAPGDQVSHESRLGTTQGPWVKVAVRDAGARIAPDEREQVFEPFFVPTGRHAKRGLGLAAAAAFVRQSGGVIQVEDESGEGAMVAMYLPVAG